MSRTIVQHGARCRLCGGPGRTGLPLCGDCAPWMKADPLDQVQPGEVDIERWAELGLDEVLARPRRRLSRLAACLILGAMLVPPLLLLLAACGW